ncbi:hypothetical protein DPEC_G00306550 [Dallia pectoralis]|uniref:Uncharacterized protein n=1 Tax=Dallia pectoralis TaxID=75939 RepID=A0ACC2FDZ9_DALPE|nr:hypothetical protein DPEC_G00306550 [Dallia pectoralis]
MNAGVHLLILALQVTLQTEHVLCECEEGFDTIKTGCIDTNECEDVGFCGDNAICLNTNGSYYCNCIHGFMSNRGVNFTSDTAECSDINECSENPPICRPNTKCINTIGSYNCTCIAGFGPTAGAEISGQNVTCEDIDECEQDKTICDSNAQCFNTNGSYNCSCKTGFQLKSGKAKYTGNEGPCLDIDECEQNKTICDSNAQCFNTNGSYNCSCNPGFQLKSGKAKYTGNEGPCLDVCVIDTLICGRNGTCRNSANGHTCLCDQGFSNYQNPQGKCTDLKCNKLMTDFNQTDPVLQKPLTLIHKSCSMLTQPITATPMDGETLLESLLSAVDQLLSVSPPNSNRKVSALLEIVEMALRLIGPMLKNPETRRSSNHTELNLLVRRNSSAPQGPLTVSCPNTQLDSKWETAAGDSTYPGFATVTLLSYKGLGKSCNYYSEMKANDSKKFEINSEVVTAVVTNPNTSQLKEPVNITFSHLNKSDEGSYTCVYWDGNAGGGSWSGNGCVLEQYNDTHTTCSSTHLSSFAVLMALYDLKDTYQLELITWVGLSLSMLCLFFGILTFSLIRSIQSTRNTIHLHLCISLFIANLVFLIGISSTKNRVGCAVVAGLLHYCYLAALCWMCMEGVHLFRMVVLVFNTTIKPLYMMLGGYGVPAVIVVVSALSNAQGYGTESHCWLSLKDGFIWSFLGPVCIIVIVNIFYFIITVWKLAQKFSSLNPDLDKLRKIKAFTIAAVAQLCVLGTMWIFGCFQFNGSTRVMSYLFTIFNTLQGALVFLMHCLLSKQVRDEYARIMGRVCAPQGKYSEFSSNQSSNSKSQNSKSIQNTGESQI